MKMFKAVIVMITALFVYHPTNAQSDKPQRTIGIKIQTIRVNGICEMCKNRIENSALSVAGVKSATWNKNTKALTVKYDLFKKDVVELIEQKIKLAGHDNEKYAAEARVYNILPDCCHYRTI